MPTPAAPGTEASPESTELPDAVIEAMLRRELLLTNAKLHGLGNEHITSERKLRSLRTQLRQVQCKLKDVIVVFHLDVA